MTGWEARSSDPVVTVASPPLPASQFREGEASAEPVVSVQVEEIREIGSGFDRSLTLPVVKLRTADPQGSAVDAQRSVAYFV